MEILKSKESRSHEVNRFTSHIGDPVIRDLNKIADNNKAYREAANSLKFDEWKDEDGSSFKTYSELLDYQVDKYMEAYPPQFARNLKPEYTSFSDKKIIWNKEAIKIARRLEDDWRAFTRAMDFEVLAWIQYDLNKEIDIEDRYETLRIALERIAKIKKEENNISD